MWMRARREDVIKKGKSKAVSDLNGGSIPSTKPADDRLEALIQTVSSMQRSQDEFFRSFETIFMAQNGSPSRPAPQPIAAQSGEYSCSKTSLAVPSVISKTSLTAPSVIDASQLNVGDKIKEQVLFAAWAEPDEEGAGSVVDLRHIVDLITGIRERQQAVEATLNSGSFSFSRSRRRTSVSSLAPSMSRWLNSKSSADGSISPGIRRNSPLGSFLGRAGVGGVHADGASLPPLGSLRGGPSATCYRSANQALAGLWRHLGKSAEKRLLKPTLQPAGGRLQMWKVFTAIVSLVWCVLGPYHAAFSPLPGIGLRLWQGLFDAVLLADVYLVLRTGLVVDGVINTNTKTIAIRYLRSHFVIDFLSMLPLHEILRAGLPPTTIAAGPGLLPHTVGDSTTQFGLRLPWLLKTLCILRASRYLTQFLQITKFNPGLIRFLGLVVFFALSCHWAGSLWCVPVPVRLPSRAAGLAAYGACLWCVPVRTGASPCARASA